MFLLVVVLSSIIVIANAAQLPPFIIPCRRNSFYLNECISNNIEAAKPFLAEGSPELSIPSLKHIVIPYSYLNRSNFEIGIWNYNISGLEDFNVLKVDADLRKNLFKFQVEFPIVDGVGSYGIKGNLLNLNVDGTGTLIGKVTKLIFDLELKTKLVKRNGITYFQQIYKRIDASVGGTFNMYMYNLYLGNTEITEVMNVVLNQNSYYMFQTIVPILENYLEGVLGKGIDVFFETYPYNQLLP